jgi:hypothetical protein
MSPPVIFISSQPDVPATVRAMKASRCSDRRPVEAVPLAQELNLEGSEVVVGPTGLLHPLILLPAPVALLELLDNGSEKE